MPLLFCVISSVWNPVCRFPEQDPVTMLDVNGDSSLGVTDAISILRSIVGLTSDEPSMLLVPPSNDLISGEVADGSIFRSQWTQLCS